MGRKAILAVVCWLTLSQALGDKSAAVKNNESAASAPRLYRNVPLGVYASAAPYASYSFHLPQFIAAPNTAASQVAAIKQKPVNKHVNTYLMDSYGNRFMESPQLAAYKTFPQQYVSLQTKLPEHLAQPLVAASPNFQFKQSGPQVFFGAPYRVPALQSPAPTPLNHFPGFGQHLVYAERVQNLAPNSNVYNHGFGALSAQQQSTNNKAVFANTQQHEQYNNIKNEPKFQRQQELPQIIVGKPKFHNAQESSHAPHGELKFQRIQENPHTVHGESKFQRIHELPHGNHGESKFQVQGTSHAPHDQSKFQRIQENNAAHDEARHQRLQDTPQVVHVEHTSYEHQYEAPKHQEQNSHDNKAQLQGAPVKQSTVPYINDVNGKTSVVKVNTEPLPLLDLTLLEPLTFANPLVPQVQHFLPRIHDATYQKLPEVNVDGVKNYQKEFVIQKTMSYDSGNISDKPQYDGPKKKQKKPTQSNKHAKKNDAPKKTTVTHHTSLDDVPEITYEINAPGHKETYKEKAVSYSKETQSEPVHYSYGSDSEQDPVTYSYTRTTKEPVQIKEVHYRSKGPSHLVYNFKPEEQNKQQVQNNVPHSESHKDSSRESEHDGQYHHHNTEHYKEHPKSSEEHHGPTHKSQEHYHRPSHGNQHESLHTGTTKHYSAPGQHKEQQYDFEPITKEYEADIRLLANAQIKVDPSHQVQHAKPTSQQHAPSPHREKQSHTHYRHQSSAQKHPHPSPVSQNHHHYSAPHSESHHVPAGHEHEKSKRVIIKEEAPEERNRDQGKEEEVYQEENNEEDFEKSYKNAAVGFSAYGREDLEAAEKDIFDPESYGVPPDHVEYDIENTPFQQYQNQGDEFPKQSRASYKDSRDKIKEDYYTDYSISKPESLLDRYQNKLGYYKLYKQQKPDYYVSDGDDKKKQTQKFAKYSVAPSFDFPSTKEEKGNSYYGHHKPKQQLYEYDYSKGAPRDNSAFTSRPYQRYKSKTNFVEPQFQYGFEPISIPKLLDSELAAMASNNRPESEKPGTRKKVYKENWYIHKKTSASAGAPAS